MRYMLLIYADEKSREAASAEVVERIAAQHLALMEEAGRRGVLRAAEPLELTRTAITLRKDDCKAMVSDGPYAETKEQLAGYYILDCQDLDEALEWAARIPAGCGGGTVWVEVRHLRTPPGATRPPAESRP